MRSRVYETIELPSGCLVSHRSTTAAACGGFAAKRSADRRYRSIAARRVYAEGAGADAAARRSAVNAGSVIMTAGVRS